MKQKFVCCSADTDYPFSFALHHRVEKEIQCYRKDAYKSMYSYYHKGKPLSNNFPRENIEIEILNYQELLSLYVNTRKLRTDTSLININAMFCKDMHIFAYRGRYYVHYSPIICLMDDAKRISELWAMNFLYKLLTREDKLCLEPSKVLNQKELYAEFIFS